MAAILGLQQRLFSRFRITTNGGQCISCEPVLPTAGIDVRSYAQKENIVRSSCGCGVCSAVCPRGVLKLEMTRLQAESILMRFY
jgi:Pyruvate/2-oxoacid:ferredoxin oxidoreductase delta subunit